MGYQTGKNKQTFKTDIGIKDFYKYYSKNFKIKIKNKTKVVTNKFNIGYPLYKDILGDINLGLRDLIVKRPTDYKMPGGLGIICIRKKKKYIGTDSKGNIVKAILPVDWQTTHEMWKNNPEAKAKGKVFRYTNEHTNNFIFEWHYIKTNLRYKGYISYYFYPTREGRKLLFNQIMTNSEYDAELRYKQRRKIK